MTRAVILLSWVASLAIMGSILWPDRELERDRAQDDLLTLQIELGRSSGQPIQPLPLTVPFEWAEVALGRRLYHDPRLSQDGSTSCATCHDLELGGTDRKARSEGIDGQRGVANAPSVFNAVFNFRQSWDGSAADISEQIEHHLRNPLVMGLDWDSIVEELGADRAVRAEFQRVYREGLTPQNAQRALTVFTSSLITASAPFDRWLRGNESAISEEAREGYRLFKDIGCVACHQGVNVGGNMFQPLGRMDDFFAQDREPVQADLGRYNVTGREVDRYHFKVPGLRNVALTAPYFHDGSIETLEEAVRAMARFQVGLQLDDAQVGSIVTFLRTLTGEVPRFAE